MELAPPPTQPATFAVKILTEVEYIHTHPQLEAELISDLLLSREFVHLLNPSGTPLCTSELYQYHLARVAYLEGLLGSGTPPTQTP